ncbi:MAG TPA: murein biosynthesis integral membrane protein MurJ [Roseiflexaceae bacterium]|nr:murein biosynthesis integral membrane protein MurJ [Roseiflexaceae bacterium]
MIAEAENRSQTKSSTRAIAVAALLIAAGNIASRLLGLGRVTVIALLFGRSAGVDAYTAAWTVPNTIYDVLIAGAVSAVFVPVLSEYAEGDRREFDRIVSGMVSCVLLLLLGLSAILAWQAPLVARVLIHSSRPDVYLQTALLIRLLLPAVVFMGLAGMATATLHAQRKFLLPASIGAVFNAGVILGAGLFHSRLGVASLAVGAAIGAFGQVAIQGLGLRQLRYRPSLNLRHPVMRRIARLYAPVALGIVFLVAGTIVDRRLASGFPAALATMQYATTLIQFPLGLIAAAIALAVLPTLSRQSAVDDAAFRATLAMGLKVVLLLVTPAAVGLATLARPITAVLFERGAFGAADTLATAEALWCYLPGLPAIAIAQLLIFAFYARKNTLVPSLVQGAAIGLYLLTALALLWLTRLGFLGLVLANSAQWLGHMLLLALLLRRELPLRGARLGEALRKTALSGGAMAVVTMILAGLLTPAVQGRASAIVSIAVAGGLGTLCYLGLCVAMRVEALAFFSQTLAERLSARVLESRPTPADD